MASASEPEQFLMAMAVLVVVLIFAILAADRALKGGPVRPRPGGTRKRPRGPGGEAPPDRTRVMTARLNRDYFNRSGGRPPRSELERSFGETFGQANAVMAKEPQSPEAQRIMKRMDEQFLRLLSAFQDQGDRPAGLHMEHNYLWLKYRQSETADPTDAFLVLIQSLGKVVERQMALPYEPKELESIMDRYEAALAQLNQSRGINFNRVTVAFFSFSARLNLLLWDRPDPLVKDALGKVLSQMVRLLLERHYGGMVQSHHLIELKVEHIQSIADQVEGLRRVVEATGHPDPEVQMACHYLVCRLRMAQLRTMTFLSPSPGRIQEMHEAHMRKLANDSAQEGEETLSLAHKVERGRGLNGEVLAQAEVVSALANHYQATYGRRHVLDSWNTMEVLKQRVLQKTLQERIGVAEELLASCDEEWSILNASTKEWFSRQVRKRSEAAQGEQGVFNNPATDGNLRALQLLSFIQAEGVPEHVLFQVLEDLQEARPARRSWPKGHRDLMRASLRSERGAVRWDLGVPGITGVLVGASTALITRLGKGRWGLETVGPVLERCRSRGVTEVVLIVNFMNELVAAEQVRKLIAGAEDKFPKVRVTAVDAKDLTAALVACLRENGWERSYEVCPGLAM